MNDLSHITAVCADTLNHEMALIACRRMLQHGFAEVVLFTDDAIDEFKTSIPQGLRVERINPLRSREDYSEFALRSMHPHVHTSHALVFQWDGFVLDPLCWQPTFLDYDYIGSPWPKSVCFGPRQVGNGGFSLRSVRLMRTVDELAPAIGNVPEDQVIVAVLGDFLERDFGMRLAPLDIARRFSVEMGSTAFVRKSDPDIVSGSTFGFHGFFNYDLAFDDEELVRVFDICMRHRTFKSLLCGYQTGNLIAALSRSGRRHVAMTVIDRVCEALKVDSVVTSRKQVLMDYLGFSSA